MYFCINNIITKMTRKIKPKFNKVHKIFFRFLKEKGVFSTLDKNKLLSKNYLPENYFQCCNLPLKVKQILKKEWIELITPKFNEIKFNLFLSFLDNNLILKDTYQSFLTKHRLNNRKFFSFFKTVSGLYPITSYYRNYTGRRLTDWPEVSEYMLDECWYKKCNRIFLKSLSENVE